jgi:hypothetical protein
MDLGGDGKPDAARLFRYWHSQCTSAVTSAAEPAGIGIVRRTPRVPCQPTSLARRASHRARTERPSRLAGEAIIGRLRASHAVDGGN